MSAAAYSRVWEIYGMLHPRPDDLISTSRYFVKEGEMVIWDEKKKKKKKRYFFLFNDILLLCRRENHKRYWLRIHITLRSPYVSIEDVENASYNNEFRLHCRSRYFILYALTPELRKEWITDLQSSISGTHPDEKKIEKKDEKKDEKKTEREDKHVHKTKQDANRSKTATDKKKIRRDDDESQDDTEESPDSDEEQEVVPKKKKNETKAPKSARTKSTGDKATKKMIKKKEPVSSGAGDLHSFDPFTQNPNLNQNPNRAQTPNPFGAGAPGWNNPFLSGNSGVSGNPNQPYQSLPFTPFGTANAPGSIGVPPVGNYGGVGGVGGGFGSYGVNASSPTFASPVNPYIDSSSGVGYPQQPSHLVVNPFVQQQPQPFAVPTNQANNPFAPAVSSPRANNPFTQNPQQYNNPF